jgi:glucokinase
MAALRRRYSHVSAERLVSGPALRAIYAVIAEAGAPYADDRDLWQAALEGRIRRAAALEHFLPLSRCVRVGTCALAHGANALVLAGGWDSGCVSIAGLRVCRRLAAKGEYRSILEQLRLLIVHADPGLYGASRRFCRPVSG